MNPYLDSVDTYYSIKHEQEAKPNRDYAGIGAVIFTFTVMSIVIALSIYTAWQIAFGQESWNTRQQIQKDGIKIYDSDYCQKNLTATAQRVCGKADLLCQEHKGESEFWDGICKTLPEELDKIK
jgi:hypothetical protein